MIGPQNQAQKQTKRQSSTPGENKQLYKQGNSHFSLLGLAVNNMYIAAII